MGTETKDETAPDPKVAAITEANVDAIPPLLGDLTMDQLKAAHAAEEAAENRQGALEAIDREQRQRMENYESAIAMAKEAAEAAGATVLSGDVVAAKDQEIADLKEKLAKATKRKPKAAPAPGKQKVVEISVDEKAKGPAAAVLFVDKNNRTFADLPPLSFEPSAFARTGRGGSGPLVLQKDIVIEQMEAKPQIHAAFLLDDKGNAMTRLGFVAPIQAGGAGNTQFAAGTLAFDVPTEAHEDVLAG